jgi:hypothetical protein
VTGLASAKETLARAVHNRLNYNLPLIENPSEARVHVGGLLRNLEEQPPPRWGECGHYQGGTVSDEHAPGDDYTPGDLEIVQEHVGALTGEQLQELDTALRENRDGVLAVVNQVASDPGVRSRPAVCMAALRRGDHRRKRMSTGNPAPQRCSPAEAHRRLYDAKASELARYEIPVAERRLLALDYAAGEVWRCWTTPMPKGGVIELERELCEELGIDRQTGEKIAQPRA